jgi:hypothetical protein
MGKLRAIERQLLSLSACDTRTITLGECALDAADLAALLPSLSRCRSASQLDLSSNFLDDLCLSHVQSLLHTMPALSEIDLRSNRLSAEGIGALALFLESSGIRGSLIKHVYVHRDGQLDAVGEDASKGKGSQPITVLTIDARLNAPRRLHRVNDIPNATHGAENNAKSTICVTKRRKASSKAIDGSSKNSVVLREVRMSNY